VCAVVFVAFVGFSFTGNASASWVNQKTPKVLVALPVLNRMEDLAVKDDTPESQVEQIKFRADSIAPLTHQARDLTNIDIVTKTWKSMLNNKDVSLEEVDRQIAENLLSLMENYQELRARDPTFAFKNTKQWFIKNWNKIA